MVRGKSQVLPVLKGERIILGHGRPRDRGQMATLWFVHHKQHLDISFRVARSWHELKGRVYGDWKQSENLPFSQFLHSKTTTSVYLVTLPIIQTVAIRDLY